MAQSTDDVLNAIQGTMSPQTRILSYVEPQVQTNTNTSPIIFQFPSNAILDFRQHYLQMQAVMVNSGINTVSFPYPFQSMFQRLVVKIGGVIAVDIDNYGFLAGLMTAQKDVDSVNFIDQDGSVTGATRAAASVVAQTYLFKLQSDLLLKVIPSYAMGANSAVEVWLYPAQLANFAELTGGGIPASYTLSNMRFFYHILQPSVDLQNTLNAQIATGLKIYFDNWSTQQFSQISSTNQTTNLPWKYRTTKAIICYGTPTADLTSGVQITPGSRFINDSPNTNIQTVVLRAGAQTYPQAPMDFSSPQSYKIMQRELKSVMQKWSNSHYRSESTWGSQISTQANTFLPCFDLRLDSAPSAQGLLGNGVDASNSINLIYNQTFTAGPGNQTLIAFCLHEGCLQLGPGRTTYYA